MKITRKFVPLGMFLKKLSIINFKNIAQQELCPGRGINCFVGDNGAGKTNAIDAVYYLSMCKSSLGMTDGQSIRHETDFFVLDGTYATDGGREERVVCTFSRKGGKVLKRNGKEYERLSDHVGLIPAVIVSPADSALISEAADERRRYLNAFISQLDRSYLASLIRYNAVLAERNRLLKTPQPDETMLQIYDQQLTEHGTTLHRRRRAAIEELQPLVAAYYKALASDREAVELSYRSELNERPFDEVLQTARPRDLANQFTTSGIHRDDLVLRIGGYPLRKYGSQGQQKSFLIALKLAQYAILSRAHEEKPLLLLDDLFDKLDAGRVEQLLQLVADGSFGQIFITDCNQTRLRRILDRAGTAYTLFTASEGSLTCTRSDTANDAAAATLTEASASAPTPADATPTPCEATATALDDETSDDATSDGKAPDDDIHEAPAEPIEDSAPERGGGA